MFSEDATTAVTTKAATVAVAGASMFGADPYLIAFIGVGFTTVGMALMGSAFSFAFGTRNKSRPLLFFQFLAAAGIGAAAVTGIPEFMGKEPVTVSAQPVVGFFYALFTRWLMPLLIDVLPMLVRRWFNIPEKTS